MTFQRICALPLTAAEMGLDWELGVNYVQNFEITIELSQFQPLSVQSWQESWENSTLDVSFSLQNVNDGIFDINSPTYFSSIEFKKYLVPIRPGCHNGKGMEGTS